MGRLGFLAALKKARQVVNAREVFAKEYVFTTRTSAQQVIDELEHHCGRICQTATLGSTWSA
jgi:hypothetical protein